VPDPAPKTINNSEIASQSGSGSGAGAVPVPAAVSTRSFLTVVNGYGRRNILG
jgi:hypothetical protein